jgi:hypothetical protein
MYNSTGTLNRRKNLLVSLIADLDERIKNSGNEHLDLSVDGYPPLSCLPVPGEREFSPSLRGFFMDRRTLRALSLKFKMLLMLLQKAYELWLSSEEVRTLLSFPEEEKRWLAENPWRPEGVLQLKATVAPYVHNEYIQPTIKFVDIQCDGIWEDFVFQTHLPERHMSLWKHLHYDTTCFSYVDSLKFFRETIEQALTPYGGISQASIGLVVPDIGGDVARKALDVKEYLAREGISSFLVEPREIDDCETLSFLVNYLPLRDLVKENQERPLPGFRKYWREGRVMNVGAHPVFNRSVFEIMTDGHYLEALGMPPQGTVDRMIPWTRSIRQGKSTSPWGEAIDIPEYVAAAREDLILLSAREGGAAPLFGPVTPQETWADRIHEALEAPYSCIAQEISTLPQAHLPLRRGDEVVMVSLSFLLDLTVNERGDIGGISAQLFDSETSHGYPWDGDKGFGSVMIADLDDA